MNQTAAPRKRRSEGTSLALDPIDSPALLRALEMFARQEAQITERFYEIFFERRPDTLELFGAHSISEREEMMRETLRSLHAFYEGQDWLEGNLAALGKSHWEYGVTQDMYSSFVDSLLDRLAESLRGLWRRSIEVCIERHRDVTQENPSKRTDCDVTLLGDLDQSVSLQRLEAFQSRCIIRSKTSTEATFDVLGPYGCLTHDPADDPTARLIVSGEAMPFEGRETSRLDFFEPSVELLLDLDVGFRYLTDRARTKGEHVDPLTRRIPHEIAP